MNKKSNYIIYYLKSIYNINNYVDIYALKNKKYCLIELVKIFFF